jgi:hypothetical protein
MWLRLWSALSVQRDPISASPDLIEEIEGLPSGTPYVLCVLTPPREERLDPALLRAAVEMLTAAAFHRVADRGSVEAQRARAIN